MPAGARKSPAHGTGYFPTIDNKVIVPAIATNGYLGRETALRLAKDWMKSGYRPSVTKAIGLPSTPPIPRQIPDRKPEPKVDINPEVKGRAKPAPTWMHFTDTPPKTLRPDYEKPQVFDRSVSRGSQPQITCITMQDQTPADVVPIQIVRLREAQRIAAQFPARVDINLDPYEDGALAYEKGLGRKACPFDPVDEEENFDEWTMGFEARM